MLGGTLALAQQRPRLHPIRRDYFAGKFLLIPPDGRPTSLQMPRLVARLADHDVLLPPVDLLGDVARAGEPDRLIEWARHVDYGDLDGVIVSLEMILRGGLRGTPPDEATIARRLDLLSWIRLRGRALPIYAIVGDDQKTSSIALDLIAAGKIDFALICRDESHGEGQTLEDEIARRKLTGRVTITPGADAAAQLLVARLLGRRFGFVPKLWIGTSASPQSAALAPMLLAQIRALNGRALPGTPDSASQSDVVLFVHAAGTEPEGLARLIESVAAAAAKGFRVALVDLSDTAASREALFAEVRRRKLLDQLVAYSAAVPAESASGSALARAVSRLMTMKFLRDDVDRLQRADRTQVELMLGRAVMELSYPMVIRPKLEGFLREQLKVDPMQLGSARDRAEAFARDEVSRVAEELFKEQFLRNSHIILLSTGERAVFEVRALQRVQLRLSWGTSAEPELRAGIYLPLANVIAADRAEGPSYWELLDSAAIDDRIVRRFDSTTWTKFKVNAEQVSVQINLNRRDIVSDESYTIHNRRRSKSARRIEIAGSSPRAVFYALARLEQLGADGSLAEDFQISESPGFAQRGIVEGFYGEPWSHRDRLDMIRFLGRMRMNRYYYAPRYDELRRERWRDSYTANDLDRFKELLRTADENFVSLVYTISPGISITYSSDNDFKALASRLDALGALGVRHFALFFDDIPETLQKAEDRSRFKTMAAAQAFLVSRVYDHLLRANQGYELSIVPTPYSNLIGAREYLRELGAGIPHEVTVFWTGIEVLSQDFTEAQAREWGELAGHRPLIWDNFPANDREPWRPFLGPKRGSASNLSDEAIGFIANAMNQAHASMLPLATVAEYAWDPRHYEPERALGRALKLLYDERSETHVRVWSNAFRDYRWDKNLFEPLFWQQWGEVDVVQIERRLDELDEALAGVGYARETGLMRGELAPFILATRVALARLEKDPAYERLPDDKFRLRADWDLVSIPSGEASGPYRTIANPENVIEGRAAWRGPQDASAQLWTSWKPEALRLRVRVSDDVVIRRKTGATTPSDTVWLVLDTDLEGDRQARRSNGDDYLIGFTLTDDARPSISITNATAVASENPPRAIDLSAVSATVVATREGYELEILLSPGVFARASFSDGFRFGMAVLVTDVDRESGATKTLASSDRVDVRNPATWTTIQLK